MVQHSIESALKMMPVWFGIGFLGPVLAELCLRNSIYDNLPISLSVSYLYIACMSFGGLYGFFAWRIARWL